MVNSEILAAANAEVVTPEEKAKAKKKKSLRQTVKTIIISALVFFVISTISMWTVGFIAISNAKDNLKVDETQAIGLATEHTYIYARDNLNYAGSMEAMTVKSEIKEIKYSFPLKKCRYIYEFEFVAGYTEIEVEVNSANGNVNITDIDRLD